MIQFFGSNIGCFGYVHVHRIYVHRMFEGASNVGGNHIINGLVFIKSFEKDYKCFFTNFSGLQQEVFPIFKLLNSTVINTFKVIKNKIFAPLI